MRIVFMGTPEFAVPSLQLLVEAGYRPIAVVTAPDKPRGRGRRIRPTPVGEAAKRYGIDTILQPESVRDPAFAEEIRTLDPDLIVVVAFRILPSEVFCIARKGAVNLHGSLLPKYRGAAPIHRAVMEGETETGVTTFFLRDTVDTGNMILQKAITVGHDETVGELHDRMMALGAEAIVETVRLIERGHVVAQPQNDEEATRAPRIHREDCRIAWERPARRVHDQVRGLSPRPGAWTRHDNALLKVYRTRLVADLDDTRGTWGAIASPDRVGKVVEASNRLVVACGEGFLELLEVQQEGKRRLSAPDFLNGHPIAPGDKFA